MNKLFLAVFLSLPFLGFSQTREYPRIKIMQPPVAQGALIRDTLPPLCVIDEVIYRFENHQAFNEKLNSVDPNTIESIDVLKGQKAIDLYGESGKNGVIVMKMKKS